MTSVGKCKTVLYADDTVLYVTAKTFNESIELIEPIIVNLSHWLDTNKLIANINKTKLMLFASRFYDVLPNIFFNNQIMEWLTEMRYLGITLSSSLRFNFYVNSVCMKVSHAGGALYSLSKLTPRKIFINLYYSLIYSLVSQDIVIWGGAPSTVIRPLIIKLNNVMRIILNVKRINNIPKL